MAAIQTSPISGISSTSPFEAHHAADHDGRLTRDGEADEGAGLEEREPADRGVRPGAERPGGVLERARGVGERNEAGHDGERRERRHQRDPCARRGEGCGRGGGGCESHC